MNITYKQLKEMVTEALKEQNVSGAVGSYQIPRAFKKKQNKI